MEGVYGDGRVSWMEMKHEMTMVGNGQQMSAAGQQVMWSAERAIISDYIPNQTEEHNDNYKKQGTWTITIKLVVSLSLK